MIEEVQVGERVGAFTENFLEKLEEGIVRPIFKCKISTRHAKYFAKSTIVIDVEQLSVDSYSRELLMTYVET